VRQMQACGLLLLALVLADFGCSDEAKCMNAACHVTPDAGLKSFESDASDARQPAVRTRVPLEAYTLSVDVHPGAAYLALGGHGLRAIDLTH